LGSKKCEKGEKYRGKVEKSKREDNWKMQSKTVKQCIIMGVLF
jgi:hypothetical protein